MLLMREVLKTKTVEIGSRIIIDSRRGSKDWCTGRTPPPQIGKKQNSPQVSPHNIFALLCTALNSIYAP